MSNKKDGKNMLDMLERMGMVRKASEDGLDDEAFEAILSDAGSANLDPAPVPEPVVEMPRPEPPKAFEQIFESKIDTGAAAKEDSSAGKDVWDDSFGVPDTDAYNEIDELYTKFGFSLKGTNTIYIIEEYLKTLPDSLPPDLKRTIVLKIVAASGFDFERLLNDGIERVTKLSDYASTFSARTDETLARYTNEIEALERQIETVKGIIDERKNMHKKQFLAIENETQRLREILDFITK